MLFYNIEDVSDGLRFASSHRIDVILVAYDMQHTSGAFRMILRQMFVDPYFHEAFGGYTY
jgi:hypothetical protein